MAAPPVDVDPGTPGSTSNDSRSDVDPSIETKGETGARRPPRWLSWSLIVAAAAAAAATGLLSGGTGLTAEALLPVLPLVAVALVVIAIGDFELFVAIALVGRASLDALKVGSGGADAALDVTSAFALVFTGFGALWLVLQPKLDRGIDRSPFAGPIGLLIAAGAVGIIATPNLVRSGGELIRLIALGVFLAVLYRFVLDIRRRTLVLTALFASAVIPVAVGLAQVALGGGVVRSDFLRITGTFLHPNPFSIYLALLLIFGVALIRYLRPKFAVPLGLLLVAMTVALVFTYTRTAWIAVLVGLIVVGLLDNRLLAIGVVVAVLTVPFLVPSVTARFDDLGEATTASGQAGNSLAWRVETWRATLAEIDNPVSGLGLRTADTLTEDGKLPHNDLVRMYVELGVLGLFAYLWLLWRLFVTATHALRAGGDGVSRGIAVGFAGALGAFVLISLVSNVMSQLVLWWYFGTMAVLAAAIPVWGETRQTVER